MYSKTTQEKLSQFHSAMSSISEVNYRDFHIVEEKSRMDVQVNSESEFLAKRIFDETSYQPVGTWEMIKRVFISFLNIFLQGKISYEVATR